MTASLLKFLALICMILDHIGEFIPNSPMWFRYLGRLSAPLFFYCSAWGLYYTHNPRKYILRLYILSVIMALGNIVVMSFFHQSALLTNNIFQTLFLGCAITYLIDKKNSLKDKYFMIVLLIIQQAAAFFLCVMLSEIRPIPRTADTYMLYRTYGALFASTIFTEGSISFVFYFIVVYYLKDKKGYLSLFIAAFSILLELIIKRTYYMRGPASYLVPFNTYQWMMIFCIPLLYIYNGKRGNGPKWFYYFFYPIHIWAFYILSNLNYNNSL